MEPILIASSILLWIVLIFNLILTLALIRRVNTESTSHPEESLKGQAAPNFIAETLSGETVNIYHYQGRQVAFIFTSPNCKPCIDNIPMYKTLSSKAKGFGIETILVSTANMFETRSFVEQFNIDLSVLVAPQEENSFMKDYKITATPSFTFIDEEGIIQFDGLFDLDSVPWEIFSKSQKQPRVDYYLETPVLD